MREQWKGGESDVFDATERLPKRPAFPDPSACGLIEAALPGGPPISLVGPGIRLINQPGADRIHADVIRFLHGTFHGAQTMIEKPILPCDVMPGRQPAFPIGDRFLRKARSGNVTIP